MPEGYHDNGASETVSEETPLTQQEQDLRSAPKSDNGSKLSPVLLIIPVAICCRLAIKLPSTTTFYVIHQYICRRYYLSHDPARIPTNGDLPDDMCSIPHVERSYAATYTAMTVLDAIGSMIGFSAISFFSSRYGRKPVFLVLIGFGLSANLCLVMSRFMMDWAETLCLVVWKICEAFSSLPLFIFAITLFIVDTVSAEARTASISGMTGLTNLGGAISFSVGGTLTTQTSNVLPVYLVAATIHAMSFVYVSLLLPESFSRDKRYELQRQRSHSSSFDVNGGYLRRTRAVVVQVLEPLKQLKPTANPISGKTSCRLVYCALHVFLAQIGSGYAVVSMLVFLTTRFKYNPSDTGYLLTILNFTRTCVLTLVIPFIVRLLRPLYNQKRKKCIPPTEEESSQGTNSSEDTDRLDVHLTIVSWLLEGLAFILLGQATTKPGQFAAVTLHGLAAGRDPVFRSLVVASVDPLKQGETLAAIEMISSVGTFISPFVMGSILTSTISSTPSLVFWVDGAIVMIAAFVLLLVRDGDRH